MDDIFLDDEPEAPLFDEEPEYPTAEEEAPQDEGLDVPMAEEEAPSMDDGFYEGEIDFPSEEPNLPATADETIAETDPDFVSKHYAESRSHLSNEVVVISDVVNLLNHLKRLTELLPVKERNSYLRGKFPAAVDSVIDSLNSLERIKKTAAGPGAGGLQNDGDVHGS